MKDLFYKLIESPTRGNYIAIHEMVVIHEDYQPYSTELDSVEELIESGDYAAAQQQIGEAMPNLLLSPNAHWLLAHISHQTDDEEMAEMENMIGAACCEGIMATGDGTLESPMIVTRPSDEYDLLFYQEKEPQSHSLVEDDGRQLDVIECEDGTQLVFDVSIPIRHATE